VPHDPPQLLPGRTAKRDFVQFIVESFGLILAFLAGIKVLEYLLGTINGNRMLIRAAWPGGAGLGLLARRANEQALLLRT
jgi:hypothetical protein